VRCETCHEIASDATDLTPRRNQMGGILGCRPEK
jgi:hypothetical protein